MRIKYSDRFREELREILGFISQDSKEASTRFASSIKIQCENCRFFPFKYRKSLYFDSELIRDMVFRRYTIVYRIDETQETIEILRIFGQNKPS